MKRQSGFSLMELMIVVAIVGILAAIGFPVYQQQVIKSHRSDARTALLRMSDLQEKFYLQNNTYAVPGEEGQVGGTTSESRLEMPGGYLYDIEIFAADSGGYTLRAVPHPTSPQLVDADCPEFTLNQAGQKLPANCW